MTPSHDATLVIVSVMLAIGVLAVIGAVINRNMQAARATLTTQLSEQTLELGKSEQQYRLLFDHNPNPMWVYGETAFLQKPFTGEQLARKVREVLDRAIVESVA